MDDEPRTESDAEPATPEAPSPEPPSGPAADAEAETAELVDELEAVAEAAEMRTSEADTTFSADLDPETLAFGEPKPLAIVCQWCNGALETTDLEICPHCGSRLKPTDENLVVPGVTTLSSEAARALELVEIQRNRAAAQSGAAMYTTPSLATAASVVPAPDEATVEAANRPPDDEVRRLMLEMELEARQARAAADAKHDVEELIMADTAERIETEAAATDVAADAAPDDAAPHDSAPESDPASSDAPDEDAQPTT
ncbi:MAG: hypothetical protein ACHQ02_01235 [Candidatus Limnocylindrales bacterium]|jgi:RNA polymerase subunit RPABC4/transcription elongation factor Spt4